MSKTKRKIKSSDVLVGTQYVSQELYELIQDMNNKADLNYDDSPIVNVDEFPIICGTSLYSFCRYNHCYPVVIHKDDSGKPSHSEQAQSIMFKMLEKDINNFVRGWPKNLVDTEDDGKSLCDYSFTEIFDYNRMFIVFDYDSKWKILGEHYLTDSNYDYGRLILSNNYKNPKLWRLFENISHNQEVWLEEARAFLESPTHTVSFVKIVEEDGKYRLQRMI